jgi:multimeric flavodoxin WrbA
MKVLGLNFGRAMKNSELVLKAALMGAEKAGAEVQFIRMMGLDIQHCTGCGSCSRGVANGGNSACILKDDYAFVENAMLDADAWIVAAPVYVLGPIGQLKNLADRFGPAHDQVGMDIEQKKRIEAGKTGDQLLDPRYLKQRYGGLISIGGAFTPHWVSMGLAGMNLLMFPHQVRVVDQIDAYAMGTRVNPVLDDALISRCEQLGANIVSIHGKPFSETAKTWFGDDPGICPVCHNRDITIRYGTTRVECPLCGIEGTLVVEGEKVRVEFSEEQQAHSRLRYEGLHDHQKEFAIMRPIQQKIMAERGAELPGLLQKYKDYGHELKMPKKD